MSENKQYFINIDPRTNRTLELIPRPTVTYNEQILNDTALYFHKSIFIDQRKTHAANMITRKHYTKCRHCQNPAIVFCEKCECFFCTDCTNSTDCTVLISERH